MKAWVLAGPTASGKTALTLRLAPLNAILAGADSRQVYREGCVGTAVPTAEERAGRDWRLIQHMQLSEDYTAARFLREAEALGAEAEAMGRPLWLVGGTAFYLRTLEDGIFEAPPTTAAARQEAESLFATGGCAALIDRLQSLDPAILHEIDVRNPARLMRAMEATLSAGLPYSELRRRRRPPGHDIRTFCLFWPRAELHERIAERTRRMFEEGFASEALALAKAGVPPEHLHRLGIGYGEALALAEGRLERERAEELVVFATRQYAHRQATWFKRFPRTVHLDARAFLGRPCPDSSAPEDAWFYALPVWDGEGAWPSSSVRLLGATPLPSVAYN